MGRLIKKRARQSDTARMTPPSDGPTVRPTATAIPINPRARPRSCAGKVCVMMAGPTENNMPAPNACTTRKATRAQMVQEKAHSSDPTVNTRNPAR